jgi:hypothetical protein
MRALGFLFLALGLTLASSALAQMEQYVNVAGRFSILMPQRPNEGVNTLADGRTVHLFVIAKDAGASLWSVAYADRPKASAGMEARQYLLEVQGRTASAVSTIESSREIVLQGIPGRVYVVRNSQTGKIDEERIFLWGERLYRIGMASTPGSPEWQDRESFFQSFKFLK